MQVDYVTNVPKICALFLNVLEKSLINLTTVRKNWNSNNSQGLDSHLLSAGYFNPSALGVRILGTKGVCKIDRGKSCKVSVQVHQGR